MEYGNRKTFIEAPLRSRMHIFGALMESSSAIFKEINYCMIYELTTFD